MVWEPTKTWDFFPEAAHARQAYSANYSGRHGGGFDPNGGAFVQVPSYQQSYPVRIMKLA